MGRRRRSKVRRVINFLRKIVAFFFSHVGLCALVVAYAMLGALTFRAIELPHELEIQTVVVTSRHETLDHMWDTTYVLNVLFEDNWTSTVMSSVVRFKSHVMWSIRKGYDGKDTEEHPQWTMSGAFLYALTVVTTIGYGHIAPRTYFGKAVTILYAIIGIPLMLLFLTNVGDILAKFFRFAYGRVLLLQRHMLTYYRRKRLVRLRRQNSLLSSKTRGSARSFPSAKSANKYASPLGLHAEELAMRDRLKPDISQDTLDDHEMLAMEDLRLDVFSQRYAEEQSLKESLDHKAAAGDQLVAITVPISIILLVMALYLVTGAVLFCVWEKWDFLDAFYYCYISLTTIGFGDLVPGATIGDSGQAQTKLVICSLYLLFGMALIAMCFNLAQEEVVNKVTRIAVRLGMIKQDEAFD